MKVILDDNEVREALLIAAAEKIQNVLGEANENNAWFNISANGKEVEGLDSVEFVVEFD